MVRAKQISVGESGRLGRIVASVPAELLANMDEVLAEFHRAEGKRASISALVEVALRELLGKTDRISVLRRYGATAKRIVKED